MCCISARCEAFMSAKVLWSLETSFSNVTCMLFMASSSSAVCSSVVRGSCTSSGDSDSDLQSMLLKYFLNQSSVCFLSLRSLGSASLSPDFFLKTWLRNIINFHFSFFESDWYKLEFF